MWDVMWEVVKIETSPKGKNVTSSDPRKGAIVEAFKRYTQCRKVTLLKETKEGAFQGSCMFGGMPGYYELRKVSTAEKSA